MIFSLSADESFVAYNGEEIAIFRINGTQLGKRTFAPNSTSKLGICKGWDTRSSLLSLIVVEEEDTTPLILGPQNSNQMDESSSIPRTTFVLGLSSGTNSSSFLWKIQSKGQKGKGEKKRENSEVQARKEKPTKKEERKRKKKKQTIKPKKFQRAKDWSTEKELFSQTKLLGRKVLH